MKRIREEDDGTIEPDRKVAAKEETVIDDGFSILPWEMWNAIGTADLPSCAFVAHCLRLTSRRFARIGAGPNKTRDDLPWPSHPLFFYLGAYRDQGQLWQELHRTFTESGKILHVSYKRTMVDGAVLKWTKDDDNHGRRLLEHQLESLVRGAASQGRISLLRDGLGIPRHKPDYLPLVFNAALRWNQVPVAEYMISSAMECTGSRLIGYDSSHLFQAARKGWLDLVKLSYPVHASSISCRYEIKRGACVGSSLPMFEWMTSEDPHWNTTMQVAHDSLLLVMEGDGYRPILKAIVTTMESANPHIKFFPSGVNYWAGWAAYRNHAHLLDWLLESHPNALQQWDILYPIAIHARSDRVLEWLLTKKVRPIRFDLSTLDTRLRDVENDYRGPFYLKDWRSALHNGLYAKFLPHACHDQPRFLALLDRLIDQNLILPEKDINISTFKPAIREKNLATFKWLMGHAFPFMGRTVFEILSRHVILAGWIDALALLRDTFPDKELPVNSLVIAAATGSLPMVRYLMDNVYADPNHPPLPIYRVVGLTDDLDDDEDDPAIRL
jgi:hypothetical protein